MPPDIEPAKAPAGTIPIFDPQTGNVLAVNEGDVQDYVQAGAQIASPEQLQALGEKQYYTGKPIAAGAAALARGGTLGMSDLLLPELGVTSKETLAGLKKYNPIISPTAEFAGAAVPIILSGGEGALAKTAIGEGTALLPTARIAQLGLKSTQAAEEIFAKELAGTGLSVGAKKALAHTGAMVVGTGTEGAFYGAGKSISEQALGDPDFTAESLLAGHGVGNILKGSLEGMAFGGGIGLGAAGAGYLAKPITAKILQGIQDETASGVDSFRNRLATRAMGPFKRETKQLARHAMGSEEYADAMAQVGNRAYMDPALAGTDVIGKDLIDEGVVPYDNLGEASVKVNQAKKLWGGKIGDIVDQMDTTSSATEPLTVGSLQTRLKSEILDPLRAKKIAPFTNIASDIEGMFSSRFANEVGEIAPEQSLGLKDLINFRRDVDDTINWASPADKLPNTWKQKFRSLLEDTAEKRIAQIADPETLAAYQLAKRKYASMSWGADAAKNRLAAYSANNLLSITDKGAMGLFGLGASLIHGGLNVGTLATGILGGIASKYLREHGASMGVSAMRPFKNFNTLFTGNAKFTSLINEAAEGLLSPQMKIAAPALAFDVAKDFKKPKETNEFLNKVSSANIDPQSWDSSIQGALSNLNQIAPNVATALAIKLGMALQNMQSVVPPKPQDPFQLPQKTNEVQPVSDADRAKFERSKKAMENPAQVLQDLANGKMSPEALQAFQMTYPAMYSKLQKAILEKVSELKQKPSFQNRMVISKILGTPMVRSLQPSHFIGLQKNVSIPAGGQPNPGIGNGTKLKIDFGKYDTNIARATRR